jgi:hypothetical protein
VNAVVTQNKEKPAVGWGKWLLLGDLGQQWDLSDHKNAILELRSQLRAKRNADESITDQLKDLQHENEELKLYVAALIRLMTTKGIASTEEITALVDTIDESDGIKDGRYTNKINLAP